MIHFEKLRWKNFLSTGNAFTEIEFTRSPSTLVIGENGAGKSTFLDALCFALFNKPFRNINKPQLVNSINGKDLLVEIDFKIGRKNYMIRRGIKPTVFEIYCNDELVDQDAALRDTQKYLEESILKLNYKSFTQIVILGSASFTPFMQLPLGQRREIIEDILDIQIFTVMNTVLKDKQNVLRETIRDIETQVEVAKQKATIQKSYIATLEENKAKKITEIEGKIDELDSTITTEQQNVTTISEQKAELGNPEEKRRKLERYKDKFQSQINKVSKEIEFYENHDDCPTCKQGIPHDFKHEIKAERVSKIQELKTATADLDEQFSDLDRLITEVGVLDIAIMESNNNIISNQRFLQRLHVELGEARNNVANIDEEKSKLKEMAKEVTSANNLKSEKNEEQHYYSVCASLLKDTGIKTRIIKQYLPAINKLVNKYLAAMDFFVQFNLDEKFNETIKSRHRDKFSYASFSEGEKQRIDLALLFTWRTIAKMKNSAATNLLILDEVFDSSLDNNGTDYVMTLLNTIGDDTNTFVISHKGDQLFDKFRSVVKFEKKQNYLVMS
jgi:DNA repair exonuclease SbcCD ATPase subunit